MPEEIRRLKDEAVDYWKRDVAANPKSSNTHSNLGYVYSERNDLEKAEFHLRKAVEIKSTSSRPHNNLGRVLLRQSQIKDTAAREAEGKAKTDRAEAATAKRLRDEAKAKLDEAIAQFQRSVELDPSLVEARLNLGEVDTKLGRYDSAATQYLRILDLDNPSVIDKDAMANFSQAYLGLARIALAKDKPDEAFGYLKRSIAKNPNNMAAWQLLTKLHYERGEYDEGEKCLQSRLAKLPPAVRQNWAEQLVKQLDDAGHHEAAAKARAAAKLPAGARASRPRRRRTTRPARRPPARSKTATNNPSRPSRRRTEFSPSSPRTRHRLTRRS